MSTRPAGTTHGERAARWAWAAAVLMLAPAVASASVVVSATLPALDPPLVNAMSRAELSTLTVAVANDSTATQIVRSVDIMLPLANYGSFTTATAPDGTWTVGFTTGTNPDTGETVAVAQFRASCSGPGIPPGDVTRFVIQFNAPASSVNGDATSSNFAVTGSTVGTSGECYPAAPASQQVLFDSPIKALYITGVVTRTSASQATVTWTVQNNNGSARVNNVTIVPVVSPATGWTGGTCSPNPINRINAGASATSSCGYTFTTPGTYTFRATARDGYGSGTSSAAGATAGTFTYGTVPTITWTKSFVVKGLAANTLALTVGAPSSANVTRIDVYNDSATGWTVAGGTSSNTGLTYNSGSTAADAYFTGTLGMGLSTDLVITYSAVPNVSTGTSYPFRVKATYTGGPTTVSRSVWLDVPIPDVTGLTIRNDAAGKVLTWTNTSGNGSTHDGVVVFREPSGTAPAMPVQLRQYTVGQDRVVFTTGGGSSVSTFTDPTAGSFNYRVCNRDAYYVYSKCSTGLANDQGWLASELAPTGGWVAALGGDALVRAGLLPGNTRIGQASNAPAVTVLDVATGARSFAPVAIPSIPSVNSPALPLRDGSTVLFAADQAGNITAVDIATGALKWPVAFARPLESFTAGVSGTTLSGAAQQFLVDYGTDVLFIGSASTGKVYAVDAVTGEELWNLAVGDATHGINGLILYDWISNYLLVPTSGLGVKVYDLTGTKKGAPPTATASTWAPDDAGLSTGDYRHCLVAAANRGIACLNTAGELRVVNRTTGKLVASMYPTGISSAMLTRVNGTSGQGFVVSSATTARVLSFRANQAAITPVGSSWTPSSGAKISTPAVFADTGYYAVGASDRTLYRVSLTTGAQLSQSPPITTQNASVLLARPVYDATGNRFLFGTNDGHLWAIPYF